MARTELENIYMVAYDPATCDIASRSPFKVYCVDHTSPFFENAYIRDLVEKGAHNQGEWFGVLSPAFFYKALGGSLTPDKIAIYLNKKKKVRTGRRTFQMLDVDALGFNPRSQNSNIIQQGNRWHGDDFQAIVQAIFDKAGVPWDCSQRLHNVVMSNYIITRPWVYEDYVRSILAPCMDVMENDSSIRETIWRDSGYQKKRNMTDKLKADLGVPYYPLHTFICERFWAVYLAINAEKVTFRHYGQV